MDKKENKRKIEACPFCGSSNVGVQGFYVQCFNCGCGGPNGHDKATAIAAWNKRSVK